MTDPSSTFQVGEVLTGTYEILRLLGRGGMGEVYEAHDWALNQRVAIKVARKDVTQADPAALRNEAQALAAIRHRCVVSAYCLRKHQGAEYLVMELVRGVTVEDYLSRFLTRGESLTIAEVLDILLPVAEGLAAIHAAGVAHRDLKPDNIMMAPGNRFVLMDLGVVLPEVDVKLLRGRRTVAGTPQYMAPEQIRNQIVPGAGHLIDLYALGVVAFELLTGDLPFPGSAVNEVLQGHLEEPVPRLGAYRTDVPAQLEALLDGLLTKDPRERVQSADAVAGELRGLRSRLVEARPVDRFSVLIVDDDSDAVDLMCRYVERALEDVEIRAVRTPEAALAALRKKAPSLIILDLRLPGMSGVELCMYMRGTRLAEKCAIIAVSADAAECDVALLRQLGVTRFITKDGGLAGALGSAMEEIRAAG